MPKRLIQEHVPSPRILWSQGNSETAPKRPGHTLIELLVAFSLTSAILALTVGVLHLILRAEETCQDRLNGRRMISNLASQFQDDAHRASRLVTTQSRSPNADSFMPQWQFELGPDHRVSYQRQPQFLVRSEMVAGRLQRQDQYPIPDSIQSSIGAEDGLPPVVVLTLAPASGDSAAPPWKEIRITASLGLDRRFGAVITAGGHDR